MVTNFFTDTQLLAPGSTVLFTATVSHPAGLSEIVGGTLEHPETGSTYGAFMQTAGGTFTLSLSWDGINGTTPISGARNETWAIDAVFFDNAGTPGRASVELMLACDGLDVCGGACVDWTSDTLNCGGCGSSCAASAACVRGACANVAFSPCFLPEDMTCAEACTDLGQVCAENGCNDATYAWFPDVDDCIAEIRPEYAPGACDLPYSPPPDPTTDSDGPPPSGFITNEQEAVRCCCG
jgi:hypothetical protein